eukprot:8056224-Karenia_brevis.AAC.1
MENTCDGLAKTVAKISRDQNTGFSELKNLLLEQRGNGVPGREPTVRPIVSNDDDGMDPDTLADALKMAG